MARYIGYVGKHCYLPQINCTMWTDEALDPHILSLDQLARKNCLGILSVQYKQICKTQTQTHTHTYTYTRTHTNMHYTHKHALRTHTKLLEILLRDHFT